MGETTHISWCDHTHNHFVGCTRISPACDGCYAAHMMETRFHRVEWGGPGKGNGTRELTSPTNRRKPISWNKKAIAAGTRPLVFCSSLADVFDNEIPAEWRKDLFDLIRATPNLVWLLLTKRPQNIIKMSGFAGGLPSNAAIGTTVEDQIRADINIPHLLNATYWCRPLFNFLSCEPLLDDLKPWTQKIIKKSMSLIGTHRESAVPAIDWVIGGGETDQGAHMARPTHPQWRRNLRDQCAAAGVPFHWKQNGEWVSVSEVAGSGEHFSFPDGATVRKLGKTHTGRTIDGVEHNEFPLVMERAA